MTEETFNIPLSDEFAVSAIKDIPQTKPFWTVVYAPGAGSNVHDPFGAYFCRRLVEVGIATVRFQFPYMERKTRRPDPPKVLEATWRQVIETVRTTGSKLMVGGRSMGGRIASNVVAQGTPVDALALFAYPLSPPGRPDRRRDEHLPAISVPTLFCSGTRDTFGTPEELKIAASLVPVSHVHLMEGADHGFSVLKSSGRSRQDVWQEAISVFVDWLSAQDRPERLQKGAA